jgi:hypothetical protein
VVEQDDVGRGRRDHRPGLLERAGHADALQVGFVVEHHGQARGEDLVVVDDEHPDRVSVVQVDSSAMREMQRDGS